MASPIVQSSVAEQIIGEEVFQKFGFHPEWKQGQFKNEKISDHPDQRLRIRFYHNDSANQFQLDILKTGILGWNNTDLHNSCPSHVGPQNYIHCDNIRTPEDLFLKKLNLRVDPSQVYTSLRFRAWGYKTSEDEVRGRIKDGVAFAYKENEKFSKDIQEIESMNRPDGFGIPHLRAFPYIYNFKGETFIKPVVLETQVDQDDGDIEMSLFKEGNLGPNDDLYKRVLESASVVKPNFNDTAPSEVIVGLLAERGFDVLEYPKSLKQGEAIHASLKNRTLGLTEVSFFPQFEERAGVTRIRGWVPQMCRSDKDRLMGGIAEFPDARGVHLFDAFRQLSTPIEGEPARKLAKAVIHHARAEVANKKLLPEH
jgi:hypothetical protein